MTAQQLKRKLHREELKEKKKTVDEKHMIENEIESYLICTATENGFLCMKFKTAQNGVPDRILIGYGLIFFIETKRPKGKARKSQIQKMQSLAHHGATSLVIDTKEQIDELFEYIRQNQKILLKVQKNNSDFWQNYIKMKGDTDDT